MSAIRHNTKAHLIPSIIKSGIRPGGAHVPPGAGNGTGGRMTSNFCAYLPTDPRNVAVGRQSSEYNAIIMFK
eukprot:6882883-Heterocapsa_arctica.AAC.1